MFFDLLEGVEEFDHALFKNGRGAFGDENILVTADNSDRTQKVA